MVYRRRTLYAGSCVDLTEWRPVGDEGVSELRPAAVVLQQSDEAGWRAGGLAQLAQLRHARAVPPQSARRPVSEGRAVKSGGL